MAETGRYDCGRVSEIEGLRNSDDIVELCRAHIWGMGSGKRGCGEPNAARARAEAEQVGVSSQPVNEG